MARPVNTRSTGKGERAGGRKHLNASLPQQLVFDFNEVAKQQGHGRRDALVENILRQFLEKVEPHSKSLRQPPSSALVKHVPAAKLSARDGAAYQRNLDEQRAIRLAREHAEEILSATSEYT